MIKPEENNIVIVSNGPKTEVYLDGKKVEALIAVDFTAAIEEFPELKIAVRGIGKGK